MPHDLSPAQIAALDHVRHRAATDQASAQRRLTRLLGDGPGAVDGFLATLATRPICLHFHPDRIASDGLSVVDGLRRHGRYRSQYETGISNGELSAHIGGRREGWEHALFGDAYRRPSVTADQRPAYGALDVFAHGDGPSPRFGSCHFVLGAHVNRRASFTWGDSHQLPGDVGLANCLAAPAAGLLEAVTDATIEFGFPELTVPSLVQRLRHPHQRTNRPGRLLDTYIEAQVHGSVRLADDVALLVADPSFRGTAIGEHLVDLAEHHQFPLHWHVGFEMSADQIPTDFRGPRMPDLARRIAEDGRINARLVGAAAAECQQDPARWADWDTPGESLQHLKQLWHVLVRFGAPAT